MRELFDQLRAEADRQILPEPAELRLRSDRRAARRLASGVLAAVVLLTGGYYATLPEPRGSFEIAQSPATQWTQAQASPVPTPTVTQPAQVACRDTYPKEIPTTLFVKGGNELCFDPVDSFTFVESVPTPCRPAARPTDALIEDRRGFENVIVEDKAPNPTAIRQVLTKYSAQGAVQFVSDLKRDVDRCGPFSTAELRLSYSIVAWDANSVQLAAKYEALGKADTGPPVSTYQVLVRRVGSYVAVVYDKGWEGYPSDERTLSSFFHAFLIGLPVT